MVGVTTRLVALGDSTVEGLMDPGPDGEYVGWADRFARILARRHPDLAYANLAVRGPDRRTRSATPSSRRRWRCGPTSRCSWPASTTCCGRGSTAPALRDNLLTMHRRLHEAGAQVLAFTMPDMRRVAPLTIACVPGSSSSTRWSGRPPRRTARSMVDFAAVPVAGHPALWHDDRLHANSEGHRRIAAALAEAYGLDHEDWRSEPDGDRSRGPRPDRRARGPLDR